MPPRQAPQVVQSNTDSPYYVHPSESPSFVLVAPLLDGSNYLAWHRSMKRALGAKNKLSFVGGSIPIPPTDDLNHSAWDRCNYLIHSWILNYVSPQIAQTIVFHEYAIDVWIELQERFSKVDRVRIASLRTAINNLKQGAKSVLEYFTELKSLWEELNSRRQMPMCTCTHPCHCESMRSARNFRLEHQVIQFLTGLNDTFGVIKTQVLLMEPLPSINKVYSLVVQEESNNSSITTSPSIEDSNILVNASEARKPFGRGKPTTGSYPPKNNSKYCTFCHKTNHTVDFCYQKHGFPNANKGTSSTNVVNSEVVLDSQGVAAGSSTISQTSLTQDQYAHLVSLLQQSSFIPPSSNTTSATTNHVISAPASSSTNASAGINNIFSCSLHVKSPHWLIDSGANEHICSSISLLHSFYKIKPLQVTLPNGTSVLVHYAGTVFFPHHFYITNVLYSPHFKVNLISVSKLLKLMTCE